MRKEIFCFCVLLEVGGMLAAQEDSVRNAGFFVQRDFNRYFLSDLYSPDIRVHVGLAPNMPDYNSNNDRTAPYILLNESTLGTEIPVYSWVSRKKNQGIKLSVSVPASLSLWFDFTETHTAPILNNDYRYAFAEINILKELKGRILKNIGIKLIPIQHESTHIGDELTLFRIRKGFPVTRLNLSYESSEAALIFNDPSGARVNRHSFLIGGRVLLKSRPTNGFYTLKPHEGDTTNFPRSVRRIEPYVRYQFQAPDGPLRIGRFYPVLSAEFRYSIRFGYAYAVYDPSEPDGYTLVTSEESYVPCINLYAGWRYRFNDRKPDRIGGYFRFYSGNNPHGQFRNIPDYSFWGVALVYEH